MMKSKIKIPFFIGILAFVQSQCDQSQTDDPALKYCQNCSLVTDTNYCFNQCNSGEYYQNETKVCLKYCGNLKVAQDQASCVDTINSCILGYYWSFSDNKCLKQQNSCNLNVYDSNLGINICQNCSLVTSYNFCQQQMCKGSEYFDDQSLICYKYCGNGLIQAPYQACSISKSCIGGTLWSDTENKCKKCENYFDQTFGILLCSNCGLSNELNNCTFKCPKNQIQVMSLSGICMTYCGQGQIAKDLLSCKQTQNCIDGYQWSQDNKCKKCDQVVIDQNLQIYQCSNCSLASNSQACQNTCQNQQYYQQFQNKCMIFCQNGNGKISSDLVGCQTSTVCVDGFYWDSPNQKCIKNQQTQCSLTHDTLVYQCPNCSLVSDITNCSKVECLTSIKPYYSFLLQKCVTYCGNGKITDDQQNCQTSSLCIDGYQWSPTSLNCFKNLNPICSSNQVDGYNLKQCSDCSLVSNTQFCTNKCANPINTYYSQQLQKCLIYCRYGVIADIAANCFPAAATKLCVDGYQWDYQNQKCIQSQDTCNLNINDPYLQACPNCSLVTDNKYCSNNCLDKNLNYYYKQENKCMAYCNNQVIAYSQAGCQSPTLCIDGFSWNSQQSKCIYNQQSTCPALKNSDQYVFVCPNCSLVTNNSSSQSQNQLCQNSCTNSLLPLWYQKFNKCMFYCGNGLLAQAQENCSSSNICIDGFEYNSKSLCNPLSQSNQDVSTNQTVVDHLFQIAVILIGVIVSLLVIIIIVFVFNALKKFKSIQEKIMQLSTENQQIKQQLQESEKQTLKYQYESANENKQIEVNQNYAEANKINESQDLEEQRQSQQTIYFIMKNDNQFEQPQCSQQQLQQTPQKENLTNQ
ncbi:hypothetical protein ABPG73_020912 [Tetrahymena malaccensis]